MRFHARPTVEVVDLGPGFAGLTGHDPAALLAVPDQFWALFVIEDRFWLLDALRTLRDEPQSRVVRLWHHDGPVVPLETVLLPPLTDRQGEVAEVEGLLLQADHGTSEDRRQARLLGMVGEELRGPVGAIEVAASTLEVAGTELTEQQWRDAAQILGRSGRRLDALASGIEELVTLHQRPVDERELVPLVDFLQELVGRQRIPPGRVVEVVGDRKLQVLVEPRRIGRTFVELIGNGLRHGGRAVTLLVDGDEHATTVSVSDDGPGVAPELAPRVFEPFVRGSTVASARCGLGLTIAAASARRSGADVTHHHRDPNGSVFTVRFPSREATSGSVAPSRRRRIVLLAADPLSGDAMTLALRASPHVGSVAAVMDVEGVERVAGQGGADLVVVDLDRASGDTFADLRRVHARLSSVRTLAITSAPTLVDLAAAVELGIAGFVPKQVGLAGLLDAAVRAMDESVFVDAETVLRLSRQERTGDHGVALTEREFDVLELLACGHDPARISRELSLQLSTCRGYIKSLLAKLDAHTQLEAVVIAANRGLVAFPNRRRATGRTLSW